MCRFDNERNQYNYLSALNEANALDKMRDALNGSSNQAEFDASFGESSNNDISMIGGDDNGR